jgi:hypothetical protein
MIPALVWWPTMLIISSQLVSWKYRVRKYLAHQFDEALPSGELKSARILVCLWMALYVSAGLLIAALIYFRFSVSIGLAIPLLIGWLIKNEIWALLLLRSNEKQSGPKSTNQPLQPRGGATES